MTMSRFLFVADFHVHPWRECSQDAGADRLADGLSCVRQILTEAQQRHNCCVVFGGDMKQTKGQWSVPVLNGLLGLFREFQDVDVFAISGNHDGTANGRSGLDVFSDQPNVHVFDAPMTDAAPWCASDTVAYWPWQSTLDGLPEFLQEAKRVKARVLVAHAFLSGAAVGPDAVRLKSEATLEQFGLAGKGRCFDWGFFGDIHRQQMLGGKGQATVWYAGSINCQNWGEREDGKGALFVDLDAGTVEPVPIQAPRFIVTDWSDVRDANKFLAANLAKPGALFDSWKGNFVRLLVCPRVDGKLLEQTREASGARAFQVVIQREARTERRADVSAAMSHGELLENYVKARPPQDGLSAKAVLDAGRRLLG